MKCPSCKDHNLEPKEIEPGLLVASCLSCEGAMISLMNYRYWIDHSDVDVSMDCADEAAITEDNKKVQVCPKCSRFMTKFQIGSGASNRLDMCTHCDEVWLDKGEWRLLRCLDLADKLPKIFTDSWQRNIRLRKQEEFQKQRFQELLGTDDFARTDEFKRWLDKHQRQAEIRQYLSLKFD